MSHGARHFPARLMAFSRERRAHIARKWHHLDGLSPGKIADRMERERIVDSITKRTINRYLSEAPADETIEKIREDHAETDLQIAERQEQLYQRARKSERRATEDNPIEAVRPVDDQNKADVTIRVPGWRVLEGDERPAHAGPEDVFIEATGGTREIPPGGPYYELDPEGNPKYETVIVGVERDQPDGKVRSFRRQEQREHLEAKGNALGVYEEQLDVNVGGSLELDHAVPDEIVTAVVGASHNRLDGNAGGPSSEDNDGS